jgi:hypothetical protein
MIEYAERPKVARYRSWGWGPTTPDGSWSASIDGRKKRDDD